MSCPVVQINESPNGTKPEATTEVRLHDQVEGLCGREQLTVDQCRLRLVQDKGGVGDCEKDAERFLRCEAKLKKLIHQVAGHPSVLMGVQACLDSGNSREACTKKAQAWANEIGRGMAAAPPRSL